MTVAFEWQVTPEVAFTQLTTAYANRIRAGVRYIANQRAPQIEAWMQNNHLWQNRTGDAEAGLHTTVEDVALDMVQIWLDHGVSYGVYLELAHGGVWGVLAPALDVWGPTIWADVQRLVRGVMAGQ